MIERCYNWASCLYIYTVKGFFFCHCFAYYCLFFTTPSLIWLTGEIRKLTEVLFCRMQPIVPKLLHHTGHLKTKIDVRLYVSLFAAKAYYHLSLSNKKHWSWRLALTRESSKQIKDAALQTTPHFVGRISRKCLALLDNELFSWPLVRHFPEIIFYFCC